MAFKLVQARDILQTKNLTELIKNMWHGRRLLGNLPPFGGPFLVCWCVRLRLNGLYLEA